MIENTNNKKAPLFKGASINKIDFILCFQL